MSRRPKSLVRRHVVAVSSGGAPICVGGRKQISLNGGSDEELCSPRRRMLRYNLCGATARVVVAHAVCTLGRMNVGSVVIERAQCAAETQNAGCAITLASSAKAICEHV